jgi:DNA-binding response OmpR family regulator
MAVLKAPLPDLPSPSTILVVDDESTALNFCVAALRQHGFHVFSASGGMQALPFFESGRPGIDLALLDVMMPGFNGVELAKRIQQLSPRTTIVLMSGYAAEEIKRLVGNDAAAYRSMWKPFTSDALVRMIRNVLASKTEDASPIIGGASNRTPASQNANQEQDEKNKEKHLGKTRSGRRDQPKSEKRR